jgi:hypothetical protein
VVKHHLGVCATRLILQQSLWDCRNLPVYVGQEHALGLLRFDLRNLRLEIMNVDLVFGVVEVHAVIGGGTAMTSGLGRADTVLLVLVLVEMCLTYIHTYIYLLEPLFPGREAGRFPLLLTDSHPCQTLRDGLITLRFLLRVSLAAVVMDGPRHFPSHHDKTTT